jgi:peroxiredoxin (alkyl hydroperoxide reductase subunit C)
MTILVSRKAPDFCASAVLASGKIIDEMKFSEKRDGKYAVIIFYPLDFTFVCPSELIALDKRTKKLQSLGVEVFTISVDSAYTHYAWRNTPISKGGIGPVSYTMVADVSHNITHAYGIESLEKSVALRATFLIDKSGYVRHQVVNDLPLGRNMDELVRMVDALQFSEEKGEVCPAGWKKGDSGMQASSEGVAKYLDQYSDTL